MNKQAPADKPASHLAHVFWAGDFSVVIGANLGDGLDLPDHMCMGDTFALAASAAPYRLAIAGRSRRGAAGNLVLRPGIAHKIATGSEIGAPGDCIQLAGRVGMMSPEGEQVDLLLIEVVSETGLRELFALPLGPIEGKVPYSLISVSNSPAPVQLADIAPVAFARGTKITMGSGEQRPIETLSPGDKVLTRDHGPQEIKWIGRRVVRGTGPYAPVVIGKGTFANASDMVISQYQRIFIYHNGDTPLANRPEVLIRARDLVDDERVYIRSGGFVEYFHLVFDAHEIIYAECIPTESLLMDESATARMPAEMAHELQHSHPDLTHTPHFGVELQRRQIGLGGVLTLQRPDRKNRRT